MAMPVGMSARSPGREGRGPVGGHRGDQIEAGGMRALIGGQRQVLAVRQPLHPHFADGLSGSFL